MNAMKKISVGLMATLVVSLSLWGFTKVSSKESIASIPDAGETAITDTITISGYTIENGVQEGALQIFMIKGNDEVKKDYLPLEKAMKDKKVVVKETGNVNELKISNDSDEYVYVQSGDIVKGGRQDRTVQYDMILPPHAKDIDLKSFCVEQGRWHQRAGEDDKEFGSNEKMLSSRKLKLAAKYSSNQSHVWSKVSEQQYNLNENVSKIKGERVDVKDATSGTSLQLALENKDLKEIREKMKRKFEKMDKLNPEAIGYGYAINGKVYGVDVYNNKKLFQDMWSKSLESVLVEAVSDQDSSIATLATRNDVVSFINKVDALKAKVKSKKVNKVTDFKTFEDGDGLIFSTHDKEIDKWVHKNYMVKDSTEKDASNISNFQEFE